MSKRSKQQANHLLGFSVGSQEHYNPAPAQAHRKGGKGYGGKGKGGKGNREKGTRCKEGFVLANFRIGVYEGDSEVKEHFGEEDPMVKWQSVKQVVTWEAFEEYRCLICLCTPRAARITQCGHIFCLPCIIQLKQQRGNKRCDCPLCQAPIALDMIKNVTMIPIRNHKECDNVHFTLVHRAVGSVLSFAGGDKGSGLPPSIHSQSARHSRYFSLTKDDLLEMLVSDKSELEAEIAAIDPSDPDSDVEKVLLMQSIEMIAASASLVQHYAPHVPSRAPLMSPDLHLVYQASDGQHLYLHPLNMHMLHHSAGQLMGLPEAAVGDIPYEVLPQEIEGKLEAVDLVTQDEWNWKKFKSLSSLPYGTPYQVALVDISSCLCDETKKAFAQELKTRRKKRNDEKKREDAEAKRMSKMREREERQRLLASAVELPSAPLDHEEAPPNLRDLEVYPALSTAPSAGMLSYDHSQIVAVAPQETPQEYPATMSLATIQEQQRRERDAKPEPTQSGGAWGVTTSPMCFAPAASAPAPEPSHGGPQGISLLDFEQAKNKKKGRKKKTTISLTSGQVS